MEQVLVALATLALAAWIVRPLGGKTSLIEPGQTDELSDLIEAKQSVYRSLIDLEMDHKLGKLAPDDYTELRQQGKLEALDLIKQIAGSGPDRTPDITLEEEIRAARARLHKE